MYYKNDTFDKKAYRENRKAGRRGQATTTIHFEAQVGGKSVSKKAALKNTKRARVAVLRATHKYEHQVYKGVLVDEES